MKHTCPKCGSEMIDVLSRVWIRYGSDDELIDYEDWQSAEPVKDEPGNNAICRSCEHTFTA